MEEESVTLIRTGPDVAVDLGYKMIPGRVSRVLRNGNPVKEIEWTEADETYLLELTDGRTISPEKVVPGPHHCDFCDAHLTEQSPGVFVCSCEDWKS